MKITLGAIKEILTDYNDKLNRRFILEGSMIKQIKQEFEETQNWDGSAEDLVTDIYEELLSECEHQNYSVEEDESMDGPDIHGNPTYHEYQYKICNICGATCPILGIEQTGEDEYDTIEGEWQ